MSPRYQNPLAESGGKLRVPSGAVRTGGFSHSGKSKSTRDAIPEMKKEKGPKYRAF